MTAIRTRKKGRGKGKKYPIKKGKLGVAGYAFDIKKSFADELFAEEPHHFGYELISKKALEKHKKEAKRLAEEDRKRHKRHKRQYPGGFHLHIVSDEDPIGSFF